MSRYRNKLILLSILSLATGAFAEDFSLKKMVFGGEKPKEAVESVCCYSNSRPERITVRHIESKGVGYNQGYTTLEGFFSLPSMTDNVWFPFLDLRGHVFNNGKFAANAGLGLRYLSESRVLGINSYYDYRQASHRNFSQYGLGLESLGKVWDVRVNGYLPVGKKKSHYYDTTFGAFEGHSLILSRKQKVAFKGINAEVGAHATLSDNIALYATAGPYYFNRHAVNAWGGEARVAFDFTKYVRLEGNTSYDNVFKWIGQGQLSLNLPFGPKEKLCVRECNTCCNEITLRDRVTQRVDRDEIIVVDSRKTKLTAIDPATGLPYFFIFVDNTSHSSGTFESPYPTIDLAVANSAPGNIIYVFPGDGTPYILEDTLTLQDNQKLWGSSLQYELPTQGGLMTIPAMSATLPVISGPSLTVTGIILGNNNEIAGMNFANFPNLTTAFIIGGPVDFLSEGITNTNLHHNFFSSISISAITLSNCLGDLIISHNQFSGLPQGIGIEDDLISNVNSNLVISNNNISAANTGILLLAEAPSSFMQLLIENNTVDQYLGNGIQVISDTGQSVCGTIQGNIINANTVATGAFGMQLISVFGGNMSLAVTNNTCTGNATGFHLFSNLPGTLCANLTGNIASDNTVDYNIDRPLSDAIDIVGDSTSLQNNNTGTFMFTGGMPTYVGSCPCH